MAELVDQFSVDRLNSASAVFDETKLKWVNAMHLRALPNKELWSLLQPLFTETGIDLPKDEVWVNKSLELFKPYMEVLKDAVKLYQPLSLGGVTFAEDAQEVFAWEETSKVISKWIELLQSHTESSLDGETFAAYQNQIKIDCSVKGKKLFMPIRTAIIGKPHGADLKLLVPLLSKSTLLERAEAALKVSKEFQ